MKKFLSPVGRQAVLDFCSRRTAIGYAVILAFVWTSAVCSSAQAQAPAPKPVPAGQSGEEGSREIESVEWEAVDSSLETNENTGGGLRILPDKQTPSDAVNRRLVRVKAKVSKPELGSTTVHFRSFDVDDPSAGYTFFSSVQLDRSDAATGMDKEKGTDNNGTPSAGSFPFNPFSFSGLSAPTDEQGFALLIFQVTMQPGDNFRIGASLQKAWLNELNDDNVPAIGEPKTFKPVKLTKLLTVWRYLHIERDSMVAPTANQNVFTAGHVNRFDGDTIYFDTKITDGSPSLDSMPVGNGRFEKGKIVLGGLTYDLLGNGSNYVKADKIIYLNGTLLKNGIPITVKLTSLAPPPTGVIVPDNAPQTFGVQEIIISDFYKGATLSVGEQEFNVLGNTANSIDVSRQVLLSYSLRDDDVNSVLPEFPPIGSNMDELFKPAYIKILVDGGGDENNNTDDQLYFIPNLSDDFARGLMALEINGKPLFNSRRSRADDYWLAYALSAFRALAYDKSRPDDIRGDKDPDSERDFSGAHYGEGAIMYRETMRDAGGLPTEEFTIIHEIGHQFGLLDKYYPYETPVAGGGMMEHSSAGFPFIPVDLAHLRSQPQSPGQRAKQIKTW